MCILSGCDYLENIPSMGLRTAYRLMRKHRDIEKLLRAVRFEGKMSIPNGYLEAFKRADMTFLHQRVFCPLQDQMVMANDPEPHAPIDDEVLVYIGPEIEADIARRVARGEIDPITKKPIEVVHVPSKPHPFAVRRGQPNQLEPPPPKNASITSFFKPMSEARSTAPKTPLQPRPTNKMAFMDYNSAPARIPTVPMSTKRHIHTSASSESKKPRVSLPISAQSANTPATAERSSFFKTQSRRPISTPTPNPRTLGNVPPKLPLPAIKPLNPVAKPWAPAMRPATPQNAASPQTTKSAIPNDSQPNSASEGDADPTKVVTQGWKDLYGFTQASSSKKLSDIIEKQRQGSAAPHRMTPLQKMGARAQTTGSLGPRRVVAPGRTSSLPSQVRGEELWPEFVGVSGSSSRNSSAANSQESVGELAAAGSQSQSQTSMFDRFAFSRR